MTAEIAVLNSHGVAMAADSAVSIGTNKVYNSANKLFALSKKQPVGVMVYGNAQFMSIPWETLIKTYRKELNDKKFNSLIEYGNDFIEYLTKTTNIGQKNEEIYIKLRISALIQELRTQIVENDVGKEFAKNPELTAEQILHLISNLIKVYCKDIVTKERLDNVDIQWVNKLKKKIKPIVEDTIKLVFENIAIEKMDKVLILEACASMFYGKKYSQENTGIVISGFGDNEIFPSLISYEIEWRVMGFLKNRISNYQEISVEHTASIVPFAQREMVDTFMEGSDRRLIEHINKQVKSLLTELDKTALKGTNIKISKKNLSTINKNCNILMQGLAAEINNVQNINFVQPVLDSVAALPLDELASMAQTLINMTSFKRRVSLNTESVGGPIDVAVISKGDGFIWINRKHYFKPELNQHYFVNNS